MRTFDDKMMAQCRKMMVSCFDYLPTKYKATPQEWQVRKFVWSFKNGGYSLYTASLIARQIVEKFGSSLQNVVFACIPASSEAKNELRYKAFSAEVCRLTGAQNAYSAITVEGSRLSIHESQKGKFLKDTEVINFDKTFFEGKKVIVFDDIITRGYSYAKFACTLENMGATVLGGLFLAKTILH